MNRPFPFRETLEKNPGWRQTLGEGLDQRARRATSPLPSPSSKERRLLDRDFNDTIKSLKDAWKDGRQADATQCAHDLKRMADDPMDWLASLHPDGK